MNEHKLFKNLENLHYKCHIIKKGYISKLFILTLDILFNFSYLIMSNNFMKRIYYKIMK